MRYLNAFISFAVAAASLISAAPLQSRDPGVLINFRKTVTTIPGDRLYIVGNTTRFGQWAPTMGVSICLLH